MVHQQFLLYCGTSDSPDVLYLDPSSSPQCWSFALFLKLSLLTSVNICDHSHPISAYWYLTVPQMLPHSEPILSIAMLRHKTQNK